MTREYMLRGVQEDGRFLRFADKELARDREIVLQAVKTSAEALQFADISLRSDRLFFLEVLQNCRGCVLQYAAPNLWADREVVAAAVKQCAWNLGYATPELRRDPEILAALQADESALEYDADDASEYDEPAEPLYKASTWENIQKLLDGDIPDFGEDPFDEE